MNIKSSKCVTSSLRTSAFQTIPIRDPRGWFYRLRKEIMTLRRLRQDVYAPVCATALRGRSRTRTELERERT